MADDEENSPSLKGLPQYLFSAVALILFPTAAELNDAWKRYDKLQRQRIFRTVGSAPPPAGAAYHIHLKQGDLNQAADSRDDMGGASLREFPLFEIRSVGRLTRVF